MADDGIGEGIGEGIDDVEAGPDARPDTRPDTHSDTRQDTPQDTRPTKIMYVAEATAHGGRDGDVTSQDGQIALKVAMPPELGGDGNGTNPEQLFAAGYSSCFHNALVLVGRREGYDLSGSTVAAKVGIGPNKQRGYGLAVALSVSLPVLDQDIAAKLVDAAHMVCPYSNATRDNIDVTIILG